MLIAGDIGGTKTNIGMYSREKGARKPLVERSFPSKQYDSLEAIVDEFLKSENSTVDTAAFGIAGPVSGSTVKTTNRPWVVSEETIAKKLKVKRAYLINDLEWRSPIFINFSGMAVTGRSLNGSPGSFPVSRMRHR